MKNKTIFWLLALALAVVPAVSVTAQEGPEDDGPEAEMMDDGDRPGMPGGFGPGQGGPGMRGGRGGEMGGPGMKQVMIKKRMMMKGQGFGGPGFLSEEETLSVIKKHDPAFAKKVEGLREMAPAK